MIRHQRRQSTFNPLAPVAFLIEWVAVKNVRHRQAEQLRRLSDEQLRDIGISRAMAEAEADRLQFSD